MNEDETHEAGAAMGDPRRCPRHPNVRTSSPDGMFDAPCGECEYEMDREEPVLLPRPPYTCQQCDI